MSNDTNDIQSYVYHINLYSGVSLYAIEEDAPADLLKHITEADDDDWYYFNACDLEDEEDPYYYNLATRIGNIADITWEDRCCIDPRCDCGQPLDCPEDEYVE